MKQEDIWHGHSTKPGIQTEKNSDKFVTYNWSNKTPHNTHNGYSTAEGYIMKAESVNYPSSDSNVSLIFYSIYLFDCSLQLSVLEFSSKEHIISKNWVKLW